MHFSLPQLCSTAVTSVIPEADDHVDDYVDQIVVAFIWVVAVAVVHTYIYIYIYVFMIFVCFYLIG